MKRLLACAAAAYFGAAVAASDATPNWPQFRGAAGAGVAENEKPPVQFGPDKNVKWKVAVPPGMSSPVVWGDKLFLTAFENGKLFTIAYDTATGAELWRAEAPAKKIEAFHKTEGSPAASTCVTDGDKVISYFGSCGLFAYDFAGKELWKYELPTAETNSDFGTGTSPVLADGQVILVRDLAKDSKILVVDAKSGSRTWEIKRQAPTAYSTPAIWDTPAGKQIVVPGYGRLVGYDIKTGAETWSVSGMPAACCTTPVVAGGLLYFAGWSPGDEDFKMPTFDSLLKEGDADKDGAISKAESENTFLKGFFENNDTNKDGKITRDEWDAIIKFVSVSKNSAFAVKPGGKGDVTKSHVVWKQTKGVPYVPSGIVYKGQYFMVNDGGLVTAYDAKTGKDVFTQERVAAAGRYYASPVAANGHIYLTTLEDGSITVMKAGSETPEIVAKTKLGERTSATPAVAGNTLYIRTAKHLYAFAEPK